MSLLELQRQMAQDVRRPLTADQNMQLELEDGRSVEAIAARYIRPNAVLSSFERLEIYNRQYWFRLIGAVAEDFPALNAVLGTRRFGELLRAYLIENPSSTWTLRDLGKKLPEFMAAHPELCGHRRRLALDVANLEWAYVDAFDGKVLAPLTQEDLQAIGPDSKLYLQPHLRLIALAYPVDELVLSIRKQSAESETVSNAATELKARSAPKLPVVKREEIHLAIHRYEDSVYYRRVPREEFLLLTALREGATIAEALAHAYTDSKLSPDEQSTSVQQCFAHAAELGWLSVEWNSD